MKKEYLKKIKKVSLSGVILLLLPSIFLSCERENKDKQREISREINGFVFELAKYSLTGECEISDPEKYFYPEQLNNYAGRVYYEKGNKSLLIEKYFPHKKGEISASGFYDATSENGDWIGDLLVLIEEQRIAEELNSMEEAYSATEYNSETIQNNIEKSLDENASSLFLTDKNNKLGMMEFEKEIFIPQTGKKTYTTIDAYATQVSRNFFDENFRLLKKENWKIANAKDATLLESEEFEFEGDSYNPSKKTITKNDDITKIEYDSSGNAIKSENYKIVERAEKKKKKNPNPVKEEILVAVCSWDYNENNKLVQEINLSYNYNSDFTVLEDSFEKKYKYYYNDFQLASENKDKIPADFEYFENDILKMKNKYSAESGTYTSQIFFENDFSVKAYYVTYKRDRDVYYIGDEVKRVKKYE